MRSLFEKATKQCLYLTDGVEVIRTTPISGNTFPFVTHIKTTKGEATLPFDSKILTDILSGPSNELTAKQYQSVPVVACRI